MNNTAQHPPTTADQTNSRRNIAMKHSVQTVRDLAGKASKQGRTPSEFLAMLGLPPLPPVGYELAEGVDDRWIGAEIETAEFTIIPAWNKSDHHVIELWTAKNTADEYMVDLSPAEASGLASGLIAATQAVDAARGSERGSIAPKPSSAFDPTGVHHEVRLGLGTNGQELLGTVAGDHNAEGPSLWLIVPPVKETEDTGVGYELNEDEAVELGYAIYASLSDSAKIRFVAALGKEERANGAI